jgi:predicted metal-dependent hydrolase
MLAISLRPGITRNPKHLLPRTSLGFEYMKKGKYISGDERGGFKVAKVNLPLPDGRLRRFLEGKEDWLEEGLLVSAKEKRKEEGLLEKVFPWPKKEVCNKIMCHHLEEFRRRRVSTVVYQCKHGGVMQPYTP